jgi:hypothetical protein
MNATVCPTDAKYATASFASQGQELLGEHVLGSTITGSGETKRPGRDRFFAQLGVVMVLSQDRKDWHTTEFVFAAELDEDLMATSLWMLHNPDPQIPRSPAPSSLHNIPRSTFTISQT